MSAFEDRGGKPGDRLGCLLEGRLGLGPKLAAVDVARSDSLTLALQLVELGLLLVELGERELLLRELLVDLSDEPHALGCQLLVLGCTRLVPDGDEPLLIGRVQQVGADSDRGPADVGYDGADPLERATKVAGVG